MKEITTQFLDKFREDLCAAIKPLEKKYGLAADLGIFKYRPDEFHSTVTFLLTNGADMTSAQEIQSKKNLEKYGGSWFCGGLSIKDYGKEFNLRGKVYTFIGLEPRKKRYPVVTRRIDGQIVNFTENIVPLIKSSKSKQSTTSVTKSSAKTVKMSDIINPGLIAGDSPEKIVAAVLKEFPNADEKSLLSQVKGPRRAALVKAGKIKE